MAKAADKKPWTLFQTDFSDIWHVRYFLDGKKVRATTGERDKGRADQRAAEIWLHANRRAEQQQPVPEEVAPLARATVVDAGANWITALEQREAAGEFREKYAERFHNDLKKHIQFLWTYVDEIPVHEPEKMLAALRTRHKANGGSLGWNSIVRLAVSVRMLVEHCMRVGLLDKEPIPELRSYLPENVGKLIAAEQRPVEAMTRAERTRFLAALKTYKPHDGVPLPEGTAYRFYVVMHYAALRRGELWALKPSWIDWKAKLIRLPATDSKSREVEEVALHPKAAQALKDQIAVRGSLEKDVPVFGVVNVRKAFTFAMKKAKITKKGITPHHHARHSAATIAAGETTDSLALQSLGRWRSLRMVERYTHATAERGRAVISKL